MKAIFFTAADPQIGLGHLFRCDALAYALSLHNVNVDLYVDCRIELEWLENKTLYSKWSIQTWTDNSSIVEKVLDQYDILVFDAYNVDHHVWQLLQDSRRQIVLFDDFGEKPELNGLLINGSPGATKIPYREIPDRTLLIGIEYQVLRPPFWNFRKLKLRKSLKKIGVLIGGTDHRNLSSEIIRLLLPHIPTSCRVFLVGEAFSNIAEPNVVLTGFLEADGIHKLFSELDLLICGGGQTVAEAVSCAIPTLVFCVAENQKINYQGWSLSGAVIPGTDISEESLIDWNKMEETMTMSLDFEIRKKCSTISRTMNLSDSTNKVCNKILSLFRRGS